MKNLIKIGVLNALILAGACQTSLINTHPLETLMPFVTRILLNSKSYLESAPGLWIKKLAQPYGLQCKYPVLMADGDVKLACVSSRTRLSGAQPKKDALDRVILDITDTSLATPFDEKIFFNHNRVKKWSTSNPLTLVSILFHENKHLDERHTTKMETFQIQLDYAADNKLDLVLPNGILIMDKDDRYNDYKYSNYSDFNGSVNVVRRGLGRLSEEEADSAFKEHPDLCRSVPVYNAKKALILNRDLAHFQIKKHRPVMEKISLFERYRKACLQDREAYEYLEHRYRYTHPLGIRRLNYLKQWINDAEKNQIQEHPKLSDALLDYCTRNLTEFRKPTS